MDVDALILAAVNVLLLSIMAYDNYQARKERKFHLDFIDRLQNKLMSRDYGDYSNQSRVSTKTPAKTFMEKVNNGLEQRAKVHLFKDEPDEE